MSQFSKLEDDLLFYSDTWLCVNAQELVLKNFLPFPGREVFGQACEQLDHYDFVLLIVVLHEAIGKFDDLIDLVRGEQVPNFSN